MYFTIQNVTSLYSFSFKGICDINIRNNRQQTPLLLAISQAHCHVAELLIMKGAALNAKDEDGDTALHLILMRISGTGGPVSRRSHTDKDSVPVSMIGDQMKLIMSQLEREGAKASASLAVACFLVQKKCDISERNNKGKKALDIVTDSNVISLLNKYSLMPR